jgi:hypothetical protein
MSSTFYIVCLSHDPALLAREHRTAEAAEAAVREGTSGHEDCDQLIVRSSGAPVEVGCPGHGFGDDARPRPHWCRTRHAHTEWVDVGWLHVLVHARLAGALPENVARHHDLSCWTEQRLWRLRKELGLELPHRVDEPGDDHPEVVHPEDPVQASTPPEVDESGADLAAEVARLRAGEEPDHEPGTVPTPGQWIWWWNRATAKQRLDIAGAVLRDQTAASECFVQNHRSRIEEVRTVRGALFRVEAVVGDMEGITGARHWASMLRTALADTDQQTTTPGDAPTPGPGQEARPSAILNTTAVVPGWRQNPDGTWNLPIDGGSFTASADISETRRAQLYLLLAGHFLGGEA